MQKFDLWTRRFDIGKKSEYELMSMSDFGPTCSDSRWGNPVMEQAWGRTMKDHGRILYSNLSDRSVVGGRNLGQGENPGAGEIWWGKSGDTGNTVRHEIWVGSFGKDFELAREMPNG